MNCRSIWTFAQVRGKVDHHCRKVEKEALWYQAQSPSQVLSSIRSPEWLSSSPRLVEEHRSKGNPCQHLQTDSSRDQKLDPQTIQPHHQDLQVNSHSNCSKNPNCPWSDAYEQRCLKSIIDVSSRQQFPTGSAKSSIETSVIRSINPYGQYAKLTSVQDPVTSLGNRGVGTCKAGNSQPTTASHHSTRSGYYPFKSPRCSMQLPT